LGVTLGPSAVGDRRGRFAATPSHKGIA